MTTCLDRGAFERLVATCGDGGEAVVARLLDTFFSDGRRLMATLHRALAEGDASEVRRMAHTLKSHGMTFGAPLLAHVAREVELAAQSGDLTGAGALAPELDIEYERARDELAVLRHEPLLSASAGR